MINEIARRRVAMNQDKMDHMKENFGDEYLEKFGMLCLAGYPIQDAIDICWQYFKPKEETKK